jgi:hypothetical protein
VANTARILYSTSSGNTPPSLVNGQIAVNQADKTLFIRDGSGNVTAYKHVIEYATVASFPATGVSGVIYVASDVGRQYRWASTAYQELGASGSGGGSSSGGSVEYTTTSGFPSTGTSSVVYIATDSGRTYRWTGSQYVEIGATPTSSSSGSTTDSAAGLTILHPFLLGGL